MTKRRIFISFDHADTDKVNGFLGLRNIVDGFEFYNHKLDHRTLQQLARHVHSSMARAIYPFHTNTDGDILFAATTNEVEDPKVNEFLLNHIASELAWDAVLHSFEGGDD